MFGILGAVNVDSNTKTYSSFEELFAALKERMQKDGYKVVKSRTHRNKVGGTYEKGSEVVRCDLVCDRGGQPYKCTATQLKTTTKKTDCPWKAKAVNRKTMGAWLLTIICDEHNHEPRTPEPPTDEEDADAEGDADVQDTTDVVAEQDESIVPTPDPFTSAALAVAGVSNAQMRLTGDTFHSFKSEYRKLPKPERIGLLAQLQLRVAALYAIENEDIQRQERQARQERKHQEIEGTRRKSQSAQRTQQQQQQQQQLQPQAQQVHHHQQQQQQQQQQTQQQQTQQQPQHHQHQQHQHQQQHHHQQQPQHQHQQQQQQLAQNHHNHNHNHVQSQNHNRARQQMTQMSLDSMAGMPKHPFDQSGHDEHAQYRDRQAEAEDRHQRMMRIAREQMGNAAQQTPVQQTPIPVPQFGMQPAQQATGTPVFRHYSAAPTSNAGAPGGGGTPGAGPQKRRGRPKKTAMDQQNLEASLQMTR